MIQREISKHVLDMAKEYPALTIIGPRQSGKTTLAKMLFPKHKYINLEEPDIREFAKKYPRDFFKNYSGNLIIDEIQRVPELLSYIQVIVDDNNIKGQFILTGSHQPQIKANIAQSLAGRTAIATLLPLSIKELSDTGIVLERDEYIYKGFMPRIYSENVTPKYLYQNYYSTYVERDVRQLINVGSQNSFERFIKLLAGRIGQIINLNSLAGDVGVSQTTLSSWISVLEASFIVFRLPCYFNNFGKRQIKTPKLYFTDVGLAAYLLGIENPEQVFRDPLVGGLFENMVVAEVLKARYNQGKNAEIYYFRNQNGLEIDLILNEGQSIIPVEIKAGASFDLSFAKNIKLFKGLSDKVKNGYIVYSGDKNIKTENAEFVSFTKLTIK
ncbi:MAG: ATP-binding protein [Fibromonadaceae bacterium]|jgi:predicted AAA+ superfamily ATPase|nr:ATP-binding protein [Fibromonadaceae bacterium]